MWRILPGVRIPGFNSGLPLTTCVAEDLNPFEAQFFVFVVMFCFVFFISKMVPVIGNVAILAK